MVHRPFKTQTLRTVLLAMTALPLVAVPSRAQQAPPVAPAQFDPSEVYFQGYLAARAAEELEAKGDFIGAAEKLEQSRKLLEGVRKYYPDWKKDMVGGRAERTSESIAKVAPKAEEQRRKKESAVAELEGGVKTPGRIASGGASSPQPGILEGNPMDARRLAEAQAEVQRLRREMGSAQKTPDANEASRNASRVGDLQRQRDSLDSKLRAAEAEVDNLRARLTTSPAQNEYNSLEQRIKNLETEREGMNRALAQSRAAYSQATAKIDSLEADLTKMRKDADEMRQKEANLNRDMAKERVIANETVGGMRRQIDDLDKALRNKTEELSKANETIAGLNLRLKQSEDAASELRTEKDALLQERDQMAGLLKLNEAGRINTLVEQSMKLAKDLREANEKVERLNLDSNAAKDDVIDALRDLAIAKSKINELHREKRDQDQRVTELEQRLKNEETVLQKSESSADPAEIEMLKDLIKRQLRIQERRRQQRDMMVETVKDLGTKDEKLADAMKLFDSEEIQLTPDEQRLLAERKVDGEFVSPVARSRGAVDDATSRMKNELQGYDRAATKAFAAGRYHPTRELYQMILESNPGDTSALCKLGIVQLRLQDGPAASDAFRRAVELEDRNPYAHRMLGFSQMMMGDMNGAERSVARSVELAPDEAISQNFLGYIQYRLGKTSEAESHYKAAIASDPMPSEPYFNLAQLYAAKGKLAEARKYYDLALERGAVPDPQLQRQLTSR
jgi:tetratricopeptide (TPR) repeat protein